jgi:hypothetical protein
MLSAQTCRSAHGTYRAGAHRLDIPPRVQVIIDGLGFVARPVILSGIDVNAIPIRSVGAPNVNAASPDVYDPCQIV